MTQEQRAGIALYMRVIADSLGLKDWRFDVLEEPANFENKAQTKCTPGVRSAVIWLSHDFTSYPPEEKRHIIIHELLHWHLWSADDVIEKDLAQSGWLTDAQHKFLRDVHQRQMEYSVDAIATAIAHHYPLPD